MERVDEIDLGRASNELALAGRLVDIMRDDTDQPGDQSALGGEAVHHIAHVLDLLDPDGNARRRHEGNLPSLRDLNLDHSGGVEERAGEDRGRTLLAAGDLEGLSPVVQNVDLGHDSSSSVGGAPAVTGARNSAADSTEEEPPSLADLADDLSRVVEGLRRLATEEEWAKASPRRYHPGKVF